jgi:hypothetical protein
MILVWIVAVIALLFGFVVFWGAPYVPSKKSDLKRALDELYPLQKTDVLVDVGSGDGVVLRAAAERGARAVGYELNPVLVWISKWLSRRQSGVKVTTANFWHVTLPKDTTVVYVFSVSRDTDKLIRKMTQEATRLGRPLWLISYGHHLTNVTPIKEVGAHLLYQFEPLQAGKAQV